MDRTEKKSSEEPVLKAAPNVDPDLIPGDAERTIEREEERGVPRADHNFEGNDDDEKGGR